MKKMVDQVLINYMKENYGKYKFENLKDKILAGGYSEQDINDALNQLNLRKDKESTPDSPTLPPPEFKGIKWVKIGGICGLIIFIFAVILTILSLLNITQIPTSPIFTIFVMIMLFVSLISILLFYFGFYKLGKFTDSKSLRFSSMAMIIFIIISIIIVIAGFIFVQSAVSSYLEAGASSLSSSNSMANFVMNNPDIVNTGGLGSLYALNIGIWPIIIFSIIVLFWLFLLIVQISFSKGLIKIGDQVRFSKIAGILNYLLTIINMLSFLVSMYLLLQIITNPIYILSFMIYLIKYKTILSIAGICISVLSLLTFLLEIIVLFYGSKKFER